MNNRLKTFVMFGCSSLVIPSTCRLWCLKYISCKSLSCFLSVTTQGGICDLFWTTGVIPRAPGWGWCASVQPSNPNLGQKTFSEIKRRGLSICGCFRMQWHLDTRPHPRNCVYRRLSGSIVSVASTPLYSWKKQWGAHVAFDGKWHQISSYSIYE